MDLFSFDFTESQEDMFTEKNIEKQFEALKDLFKRNGNGYIYYISDMPRNMALYLDKFEEMGWIERRGDRGVNILDAYLKFHTVDEAIEPFRQRMYRALKNPNVSWYENVLPVYNYNAGLNIIRYKNDDVRTEIWKQKRQIGVNAAKELGLKHFLDAPSSRGQKMNPFSSKWAKENVFPLVVEKILPITDYQEMDKFFDEHLFFFGRRDFHRDGVRQNFTITPYPEFRQISPSMFEVACLCEASDEETIKLILDYAGTIYSGISYTGDSKYKVLYPEGWSMTKYEKSLTDDDKEVIRKDQERLKRLHSTTLSA